MKTSFRFALFLLALGTALGTQGQPVLSIDFKRRNTDPATNTQPGFNSFIISSNVNNAAIQTQATTRVFGPISVTVSNEAPIGYDDRLRTLPTNTTTFTDGLLFRDFVFSRDVNGLGGLDVGFEGLTADQAYRVTIWSYDNSSGGFRSSDWFANSALVRSNYVFDGRVLPTNNAQYRFSFVAVASGAGQMVVQGRRKATSVDTANVASFGVFLNALQLEPTVPSPVVTTQPVGGTRGLGDRHTFAVIAEGVEPYTFTYQWSKDGVEIPGATESSYTRSGLRESDSGRYTVLVSNSHGAGGSLEAVLTVLPDPAADVPQGLVSHWAFDVLGGEDPNLFAPDLYSQNHMKLIYTGFVDQAEGVFGNAILFNGTDQYSVREGGFPIYNNPAFSVAFFVSASFLEQADRRVFAESSTNNANPVFSMGTSTNGTSHKLRVLIRNDAGAVLLDRSSTRDVMDGPYHHVVWTEANGLARLYIDGELDETDFTYNHVALSLNQTTLGALLRSSASNFFSGWLDDVAVWNRVLTYTEIQEIRASGIVDPVAPIAPMITTQPVGQSVMTLANVTFSFAATGTSPLDAQWLKNGTPLTGETNTTLTLPSVALDDAGDYSVVVTNIAGSATSDVATLTVTLRPPPAAGLKIDFNDIANDTPANTEPGFSSFALSVVDPGPVTRVFGGTEITLTGVGLNLDTRKRTTPTNGVDFTEERLLQDFVFVRDTVDAPGMDVAVEFLEANRLYTVTIWSFDSVSTGTRVSDWFANAAQVREGWAFDGAALPVANDTYRFSFDVISDAAGKILIQGRRAASATAVVNVFLNALEVTRRDLRVQDISVDSFGDVLLTIATLNPGATHRVDQKTSIDLDWTPAEGVVFGVVGGNIVTATVPASADGMRFFRVVEVP